ncbi:MAG: 50S ribosomal protein L23 [Patescibacteria group bacterium]|jgi:large subunit ribosomal protein L23
MGLLNKLKKTETKKEEKRTEEVKKETPIVKVEDKKSEDKKEKTVTRYSKDDTGSAYKVLLRPVLTEKVTDMGSLNKYVFEVSIDATKNEVKKAVHALYGVDPVKVNIIKLKGKWSRYGSNFGQQKNWKKAVVTLKEGENIQIYEGV